MKLNWINVLIVLLAIVLAGMSGCTEQSETEVATTQYATSNEINESRFMLGIKLNEEIRYTTAESTTVMINVTVMNKLDENMWLYSFVNADSGSFYYGDFWPVDNPQRVSNGTYEMEVYVPIRLSSCGNAEELKVLICLLDEEGINEISSYDEPYSGNILMAQTPISVTTYIEC